MSTQIVISGWPSSDKVPGSYGIVQYGAGAQSAGSIPKKLLIVGLRHGTLGNITLDTEQRQIFSSTDAETATGAGGEATCMSYDALQVPGSEVFVTCPTPATGAVASSAVIDFGGTWTTTGSWIGRFAGVGRGASLKSTTVSVGILSTHVSTDVATNVAAAINAYAEFPYSASVASSTVTLTLKTPGARGNQHVFFQDTSQMPSGATSYVGGEKLAITSSTNATPIVVLTGTHGLTTGDQVEIRGHLVNTSANGVWTITVVDATHFSLNTSVGVGIGAGTGSVYGPQVPGTGAQSGAKFFGGSGIETLTNLTAALDAVKYDRIALAQNDATSLAAWKTQIDGQSGVLKGKRQHAIFASGGTLTATQSLAQVTVNHQRIQCMWHLNSETHPSRIAAVWGAVRASEESSDPGAGQVYAGYELPTVQPQLVKTDWSGHSTKNTALVNGVTPITTDGDGAARVVRSIVTHSLNGANPDYSTFDTCDAVVPDYVLDLIQSYDVNVFFPANKRVDDDPPNGEEPPAGVATPKKRTSDITSILRDCEVGANLPAPVLRNVDDNLPYSAYDKAGRRILSAVNCDVCPPNISAGSVVRQIAA